MISSRAAALISTPSAIMVGHSACCQDPFSKDNPNGYLNFGIAENRLIDDLALEAMRTPLKLNSDHVHYLPLEGMERLREAFAGFARRFLNAPEVQASNVLIQTGLSSVCESMAFALFEEGDEIIVPAPYYTGFKYDFDGRFKVKLISAQLKNFEHNIEDVRSALTEKTKAILLTGPHNPTGDCLSEDFLRDVVELCKEKGLHLISDEIYALSIHAGKKHLSVLEVDKEYENIHVLYGMAKDFGMAGIKTGFYYTRNKACLNAMAQTSYFHPVASPTQQLVAQILEDHIMVENFTKKSNARVEQALASLEKNLPSLKFRRPQAGMFLLADLRSLLDEHQNERALFNFLLNELKINMTPGTEMGLTVEGFFRVCYARDKAQIEELGKRLGPLL